MSGSQVFSNILVNFDDDTANRIMVDGNLSGNYVFVAKNVGDVAKINSESIIHDFIVYGTENGAHDYQLLLDGAGTVFEFGLYRNAAGNGYDIATKGWGPGGQVIINTMGGMSIGWFSQMDSLLKRMGELRISRNPKLESEGDFWFRGYGQQANVSLGIDGVNTFVDYQYGSDFGYDRIFHRDEDNFIAYGVFAGYQGAKRRMHDPFSSSSETNGAAFGFYVTWMNSDGWYADLVAKGQYWDSEFETFGESADFTNWGAGASIEIGRQIALDDDYFVEPSAQFAYLHMFSSDYNAGITGTAQSYGVNMDEADVYRFQGLVRLGRNIFYNGFIFQPYIKGGIETQFSSGGWLEAADRVLRPNTDGNRAVFGAGFVWQMTEKTQIHLDYEGSFGDKYDVPWRVNAGFRYGF